MSKTKACRLLGHIKQGCLTEVKAKVSVDRPSLTDTHPRHLPRSLVLCRHSIKYYKLEHDLSPSALSSSDTNWSADISKLDVVS
jgi:hypothetical protein